MFIGCEVADAEYERSRGARGIIVGLSGLQRVAWRAVLQATVLC